MIKFEILPFCYFNLYLKYYVYINIYEKLNYYLLKIFVWKKIMWSYKKSNFYFKKFCNQFYALV